MSLYGSLAIVNESTELINFNENISLEEYNDFLIESLSNILFEDTDLNEELIEEGTNILVYKVTNNITRDYKATMRDFKKACKAHDKEMAQKKINEAKNIIEEGIKDIRSINFEDLKTETMSSVISLFTSYLTDIHVMVLTASAFVTTTSFIELFTSKGGMVIKSQAREAFLNKLGVGAIVSLAIHIARNIEGTIKEIKKLPKDASRKDVANAFNQNKVVVIRQLHDLYKYTDEVGKKIKKIKPIKYETE